MIDDHHASQNFKSFLSKKTKEKQTSKMPNNRNQNNIPFETAFKYYIHLFGRSLFGKQDIKIEQFSTYGR